MLIFTVSLILSASGVGVVWCLARRRQWLDYPNERSSHDQPIPTGGGIALVLIALATIFRVMRGWLFLSFFPAVLLIATVSVIDDFRGVSIHKRLFIHGLASLLIVGAAAKNAGGSILFLLFSLFFIMTMANFYNFMDGIDGLAGLEGLWGGLFLAWLSDGTGSTAGIAPFFYVLAGGCLGFLFWNFPRPRARIFLGDVGSTFLGFSFAALWCLDVAGDWFKMIPFLLIFGNFLVDAGLTLILRCLRGEAWHKPHRQHLYQLLVQAGCSHLQVSIGESVIVIAGGFVAWIYRLGIPAGRVLAVLYAVFLVCLWFCGRRWALARLMVSPAV